MGKTKIEWARNKDGSEGMTWNPVRGCSRVSEGCRNCYAERMAARELPGMKSPTTGDPFAIMTPSGPRWTGKVELIESMLDIPLRRKKPTTYFVNSMSDLFHEALPDEVIDRVFAVMALCPQHTFQLLTKRGERLLKYIAGKIGAGHRGDIVTAAMDQKFSLPRGRGFPRYVEAWPLPNVWLGVSVEDRANKDRIDHLRATPATVRFVSFAPLLEDLGELDLHAIDLAIWGGESGPGARPCDIAWVRRGMEEADGDGCQSFVKQPARIL